MENQPMDISQYCFWFAHMMPYFWQIQRRLQKLLNMVHIICEHWDLAVNVAIWKLAAGRVWWKLCFTKLRFGYKVFQQACGMKKRINKRIPTLLFRFRDNNPMLSNACRNLKRARHTITLMLYIFSTYQKQKNMFLWSASHMTPSPGIRTRLY